MTEKTKHRRIVGEEREKLRAELARRYRDDPGTSVRSLAEHTGRSYGFIHRVLREAGVELRPRGGAR